MSRIVLATLNARYIHSALGLRYLLTNMGPLREQTALREFTLENRPIDIVERLLAGKPRIIGLGVYIWNVEQSTRVAALLKQIAPEVTLVLGGPEVSFEWEQQPIVALADHLITGQADHAFVTLCGQLLNGGSAPVVIHPPTVEPAALTLPYDAYGDDDIAHRVIYVEASRGCPFKCEFCLSALERSSRPFPLDPLLQALERLYRRGVRHFKFVDLTFNLDPRHSGAILDFFLQRMDPSLFLHFEVIPDRLPDTLRSRLARFPPGSLQLELGVQSFNPGVQALISRRQDNSKSVENLRWLRQQSHAHLHTDLILGLPGEGMQSFAAGFDRLYGLRPHEIQVGELKRLRIVDMAQPLMASGYPLPCPFSPEANASGDRPAGAGADETPPVRRRRYS
ncbi:MAG: radical SAM protein [Candidatus Sedimenticola endophacoides]